MKCQLQRIDAAVSAQVLLPRTPGIGAPTFADSSAVAYRVSAETALPYHRERPLHETPTKKMLKYHVDDAEPRSRSVLDFHPLEVARQLALAAHDEFVRVRPAELQSRAWMKDSADVHAKLCPNVKQLITQFNRQSRWVATEIVRVTSDAQQRLSVLKRFIELAHCCRDVQNLYGMYAIYVGLNQWAVQRLKALWAALPTKWLKRYEELDQLCNPKSNSAAMRALLRSLDAPVVPPIDLFLRDLTALGEMDEYIETVPPPPPLPSDSPSAAAPPPLPLLPSGGEHEWACSFGDDRRILNLNKKRREADVLRRVRRCQRGRYVFAEHAEIGRYLFSAREPFDDAQLSALSNLCEPSNSAAANAVDSEAVLAPLKAAGELPTVQGRARAGSMSSRLSGVFARGRAAPPKPGTPVAASSASMRSSPASPVAAVDSLKSRGRLASMPVRPQFNVAELSAAGKQADLETERLRAAARPKSMLIPPAQRPDGVAPAEPDRARSPAPPPLPEE